MLDVCERGMRVEGGEKTYAFTSIRCALSVGSQ